MMCSLLLDEVESQLARYMRSVECPHCKATYVYKDVDITTRIVKCQNCLKQIEIPENHRMFLKSTFPDISNILSFLEIQSKIPCPDDLKPVIIEEEFKFEREALLNSCPNCSAEIDIGGLIKPDGTVICPKSFKRFKPGNL